MIRKISPQADRRPELKRLISRVKRDQERERARHGNGHEEGTVKRFQLPKKYMQQEEFVKCIQESGIVKDNGTILRLFDALTVGKGAVNVPHVPVYCARLSHFCIRLALLLSTASAYTLTHHFSPLPPTIFQANIYFLPWINNYLATPFLNRLCVSYWAI